MIFSINKIENALSVKIARNRTVLGLDTATKSGWCIVKTDDKKLTLSTGFINIDVSKITDQTERNELRYNVVFDTMNNLINDKIDVVVIENVFHGVNANTTILLSRIGAIAWCICKINKAKKTIWLTASQARKTLNINQKCPKGKSKETIVKRVNELLNINITNNDEIDAIVLAICGLTERSFI